MSRPGSLTRQRWSSRTNRKRWTAEVAHEPTSDLGDPASPLPELTDDVGDADEADDGEADPAGSEPLESEEPVEQEEPEEPAPPSALSLAVDSFLAGESPSDAVETEVQEAIAQRAYDDVVEQLSRLVDEGAEREGAIELARSSLTHAVRSRMVMHLGSERDEEARARWVSVFSVLGSEMAEAVRDVMEVADDRFARRVYVETLVGMGDVSRPVVEEMAIGSNGFLARNAVGVLAEIGDEEAQGLIVTAAEHSDRRVREAALSAIERLRIPDTDEIVLGKLVRDEEASVRLAAGVAAAELGLERAVRHLVSALEAAGDDDTVITLARCLGKLADPGAVQALEKHAAPGRFNRTATPVRIAAYQALNHIGTPHARRLLNQAVSDKDPEVKAAVKELLHMR